MDDQKHQPDRSGGERSEDRLADDQQARGIPTADDVMDPGMDTTMGRAKATINPPAGLGNEVEGVGSHGAEEGEEDAPKRGSEAQQTAQQSAARAFDRPDRP